MNLRRRRAFSLLEVMVAMGLLSLMITIVMSAQSGLVRTDRASAKFGVATTLARCRMTEIEEKLLKFGYTENDEIESSNICCDDREEPGFACEWKIEKVILPPLPQDNIGADAGLSSMVQQRARWGRLTDPRALHDPRDHRDHRARRDHRPRRRLAEHRLRAPAVDDGRPASGESVRCARAPQDGLHHRLSVVEAAPRADHPPRGGHREVDGRQRPR